MLRGLTFILMISALAACSLTRPVAVPEIAKFTLNQPSVFEHAKPRLNKILLVSLPKAMSGYQTSDIVYTKEPYRLERFTRNRWEAAPAAMLQPLIVESLRNAQRFKSVVAAPGTVNNDYRLEVSLLALRQEFSHDSSAVRLTIDATMIQSISNNIIATQRFSILVSARPNPQSGVAAANQATKHILEKLVDFVSDAV